MGMMGSIFGELKQIDNMITSPSSTLGKWSDSVREELTKIANAGIPHVPAPMATLIAQPAASVQQQAVPQPAPQIYQPQVVAVPVQVQKPVDTDQFEFDFDKKARYIEVVDAIESLKLKVEALDDKLDVIISLLKTSAPITEKNKKKVSGIQNL